MSRRFVSIWFPHLATDLFALSRPELQHEPFVLNAPSHGRMMITAANRIAQELDIYPGMVLADARAVCHSLQNFDDAPEAAEKLLRKIAEWCIRFTPVAAVDPPDGIILEATGCAHLWGGEEAYLTCILTRIKRKGFDARAAMADTIGAAWAVCRYGNAFSVIESSKQSNAILPLPPEALRLNADNVLRLHKLGLHQVKDFISIHRTALRRRFGKEMILRLDQALGTELEIIEPIQPAEPYQERLPCLEPILRRQGIEIALQQLLDTLCKRLSSEGRGLRICEFKCYRIDNREVSIQIHTNAPSNNPKHLFNLFELKLSSVEPDPGIELFILTAAKVEEHSPVQEEFWKQSTGLTDYRISELLDRLTSRYGADAIHRFLPDEHYLPERSIKKASSIDEKATTTWKSNLPRPLRLLSVPAQVEVTAPIPDYPPMLFRYQGKLHKIIRADGPERIEQEWWLKDGEHRDYYAVEDEEGCRYWLFRSGHYDAEVSYQWFLHGFFV
jgi:protein ImuB